MNRKNDEKCLDDLDACDFVDNVDDVGNVAQEGKNDNLRERRENERKKEKKRDRKDERKTVAPGAGGVTTRHMKQMSQTMAEWIATPVQISKAAERVPDVWE